MDTLKHFPIPVPEPLQHLSAKELEVFFNKYFVNNERPSDLLEEYGVKDFNHRQFERLYMPKQQPENSCPEHNTYAWIKPLYKSQWTEPYCPVCQKPLLSRLNESWMIEIQQNKRLDAEMLAFQSQKLSLSEYKVLPYEIKLMVVFWFFRCPERYRVSLETKYLMENNSFAHSNIANKYLTQLDKYKGGSIMESNSLKLNLDLYNSLSDGDFFLQNTSEDLSRLWYNFACYEVHAYLLNLLSLWRFYTVSKNELYEHVKYLLQHHSMEIACFVVSIAIMDVNNYPKTVKESSWANEYVCKRMKVRSQQYLEDKLKMVEFFPSKDGSMSYFAKFFAEQSGLSALFYSEQPHIDVLENL